MTEEEKVREEIELGRIIMQANPGLSPYQAVLKAKEMLLNPLKIQLEEEKVPEYADFADLAQKNIPRSGVLRYDPTTLPLDARRKAPSNQNEWMAGVLGHEVLGHGGDATYFPGMTDSLPEDAAHFGSSPSYKGKSGYSISDLIASARQQLPPSKLRQQLEAQAQAEARQRGLPLELPTKAKWER